MRPGGRQASMAVGVAVGALLLWFAFRDVRPLEIIGALADFRPVWLPVIIFFQLLDLLARAARWQVLLAPMVRADLWLLYQIQTISLTINNLILMRLGEFAKGVIGGQELKIPTISVLATVVVERICDTISLLVLFAGCSFFAPDFVDARIRNTAAAGAAGLFAALLAAVLGGAWLRGTRPFAALRSYPVIHRLAEDLIQGTQALRSWSAALRVAAFSCGLWLSDAAMFWAAARAMNLEPPLLFTRSVFALASAAAACALPSLPGAFGNFEAAVKAIMHHLGYSKALALSYGAFLHLMVFSIVSLMGVVFFYRLGHTFAGLRQAVEKK
ncbi:MAG: lysylphosphatidylglycerol synthase transmembrane domain-containing protein [Elusimicrobiota bacterium]